MLVEANLNLTISYERLIAAMWSCRSSRVLQNCLPRVLDVRSHWDKQVLKILLAKLQPSELVCLEHEPIPADFGPLTWSEAGALVRLLPRDEMGEISQDLTPNHFNLALAISFFDRGANMPHTRTTIMPDCHDEKVAQTAAKDAEDLAIINQIFDLLGPSGELWASSRTVAQHLSLFQQAGFAVIHRAAVDATTAIVGCQKTAQN
jgi:hypothetical protein